MDTAQGDLLELLQVQEELERLGLNARDDGARRSLQAGVSNPDAERTREEVDALIATGFDFTTDELSPAVDRRIAGALILSASSAGRIRSIGRTRSKRLQAHGRWIEIWRVVR